MGEAVDSIDQAWGYISAALIVAKRIPGIGKLIELTDDANDLISFTMESAGWLSDNLKEKDEKMDMFVTLLDKEGIYPKNVPIKVTIENNKDGKVVGMSVEIYEDTVLHHGIGNGGVWIASSYLAKRLEKK